MISQQEKRRIAIVGAGVAGIVTAHILQRNYDVTLFERNNYLGGHTNTIVLEDGPDSGTPVDTGFIVLNDQTYPLFTEFLNQLSVKKRNSHMSFSYYDQSDGFQYAGTNLNGIFAQRKHIFSRTFYQMISGILRFNKQALYDLNNDRFNGEVLGQYLTKLGIPDVCTRRYLIPMGAAIWSATDQDVLDYPAESFARFFKNHGLLSLKNGPQWQTVVGGSHAYVKAFEQQFSGRVHLQADIEHVRRHQDHIMLRMADGREERFDGVVLATHADESLRLLADPTTEESKLLGSWRYSQNHTVLHTDTSVLPKLKRAWASWNYVRGDDRHAQSGQPQHLEQPVSFTYHMNRLQGLQTEQQYLVTLNGGPMISPHKKMKEMIYRHPIYTFESMQSQQHLPQLNGQNNTYFCGSYFGYGFHEDAVRSGVEVARKMGLDL